MDNQSSEWKIAWQSKWDKSFRDVSVPFGDETRIADIRMSNGLVVQFISNPSEVTPEYIRTTEATFQKMVWVMNASEYVAKAELSINRTEPFSNITWRYAPELAREHSRNLFLDTDVPNEIFLLRYLRPGSGITGYGSVYTHFDLVNNNLKTSKLYPVFWKDKVKDDIQTMA